MQQLVPRPCHRRSRLRLLISSLTVSLMITSLGSVAQALDLRGFRVDALNTESPEYGKCEDNVPAVLDRIAEDPFNPNLTQPSLWLNRDIFAFRARFSSKLFENWLVCPSLNRDRGRIDLVVNGQLWGLLDYFERYELLQQFGNGSDRPDQRFKSGYDLRIFTKQGGNPLAYYTCLSTPTATLTATSNLKSQDPKSPDLKSQNLTPQDITSNGPRTSGIDSKNNSEPNLLTTTALVPERSSRRCRIHIRDFNNGLGIRSPL